MAEANPEFGRAVAEVLQWMGVSPETAGAALGINARTLTAMSQGIVPMRSLVLRFAHGLSSQPGVDEGAHDWWSDADAWLIKAGYAPRREGGHPAGAEPAGRFSSERPAAPSPGNGRSVPAAPRQPGGMPPPRSFAPPLPPGPGESDPPAHEYYRPVYERQVCGGTVVHVFWILDGTDRKCFQIHMPANVDYKARAAQVKADLHSFTRSQFERKYSRFRVHAGQPHPAAPGR